MTEEFKTNLLALRKKKGLSQEFLADKLFVSRQTISKWENGETTPDLDNLINLAALFEITLDELVFNTPSNSAQQTYSIHDTPYKNLPTHTDWGSIFNKYWWLIFPIGAGLITIFDIIFSK